MADRWKAEELLSLMGTLNSIVEERLAATHDLLDRVTDAVRDNTAQLAVLQETLDEFRELLEWAIVNDRLDDVPRPTALAQRTEQRDPAHDESTSAASTDGLSVKPREWELF